MCIGNGGAEGAPAAAGAIGVRVRDWAAPVDGQAQTMAGSSRPVAPVVVREAHRVCRVRKVCRVHEVRVVCVACEELGRWGVGDPYRF